MGKVHSHEQLLNSCYLTSKHETFTIWMKSLVLNGKGCTVFDSNGHIMYRVDNYNSKSSGQVFLMDFNGRVLFTILKKKFRLFGSWEGYRPTSSDTETDKRKPGFQVKKNFKILTRNLSEYEVILGLDNNQPYHYIIKSWSDKSDCSIVDKFGELVAEVKRKETRSGVVLGDDVLTMEIKPCIDHSIIMGLVVVCSLINSKM